MKILVVGDHYYPTSAFEPAFEVIAETAEVAYLQLGTDNQNPADAASLAPLKEFLGSPEEVAAALPDCDILVVHAAPVTRTVLEASSQLKLVVCARGGPLNVDIEAATELGIPVSVTPGKNADAVAELTIAFMIILARRLHLAMAHREGGDTTDSSTFEGLQFFGTEIGGRALGLVGYGNVGRRVANRAAALGMRVLAHDPYVTFSPADQSVVEPRTFDQVIAESDYLSLHARATPETQGLMGREQFEAMRNGAFFINTARETLVDEGALYSALTTGHLAGAGLDVVLPHSHSEANPLFDLDKVIVTPHIGGATSETLARGAQMTAEEVERFATGGPLLRTVNREVEIDA